MNPLVLGLDLLGTFVFALSGATLGARRQFDRFLQVAPNDDRAQMVQGLLLGLLPNPSASPSAGP